MELNWREDHFYVTDCTYRISVNFVDKALFLLI